MRVWKLALILTLGTGITACDVEQADSDDFEAAEMAEPAAESPRPETSAVPVLTSNFETPQDAETADDVSGTVRVFSIQGPATATDAPVPGTADEPGSETAGADTEQGFRIDVEIEGLSQGEHAWHIHDAPCGEQGGIVVAMTETNDHEGLARPLSATGTDQSVRADATVPADQLSLEQLRTGEYSLHVHARAGADHGPTAACANLTDDTGQINDEGEVNDADEVL